LDGSGRPTGHRQFVVGTEYRLTYLQPLFEGLNMKKAVVYYFEDQPQFAGYEPRSWAAHYLRACRNSRGNMGMNRYIVARQSFGKYTIRLNMQDSPIAIILTH
jgi:hypothetical protein